MTRITTRLVIALPAVIAILTWGLGVIAVGDACPSAMSGGC